MSSSAVEAQERIEPEFEASHAVLDADYKLYALNAQQMIQIGEALTPFVEKALEVTEGFLTAESLLDEVQAGRMQFWAIGNDYGITAVVGTRLLQSVTGIKYLSIDFVAGENSPAWLHLIGDLEEWAAGNGCSMVQMMARKGLARKLDDYRMRYYVLEKRLG